METVRSGRGLRIVNAALLVLAVALVLAGATYSAQQELPTLETATLWSATVQRGEFTRQVRGAGMIYETEAGVLMAQVRIPETQSFDLEVGQTATIDLRVAKVAARVTDLDRAIRNGTLTVTVEFTADLPRGTRPGMSIDGIIDIESVGNVLYVGRPAYGRSNSTIGLFKIIETDSGEREAVRVSVKLGLSSVNVIVVESGLEEGDQVILSDMSRWDAFDRVRLR